MSQTEQTTGEVLDSLTGHEEMWIADQFGKSIGEMAHRFLELNDVGPYYRALIFAIKRREGINEDDARNAVMDMRMSDVLKFFPRADDDAEGAEGAQAVEESGKDEPEPQLQPESSLISAS